MADRPGITLPPPTYPAAAMAIAWAADRWLGSPSVPAQAAIVGIILACIAVAIAAWAAWTLFRHRTTIDPYRPTTTLVEAGPFRRSRNPIYVSFLVLQAGLSLWTGWLWGLALLPATAAALRWLVIAKEERYLEAKFGQAYRLYCDRVRRWIGRRTPPQ